MSRILKLFAAFAALIGLAFAALVWFGIGEHERLFGEPVLMVFPKGFTGLVCVQSSPGPPPTYSRPKKYVVSGVGLVLIDADVLQSHNPRKYFERDPTTSEEFPMSPNYYLGIFGESGPNGVSYTVGWVGKYRVLGYIP